MYTANRYRSILRLSIKETFRLHRQEIKTLYNSVQMIADGNRCYCTYKKLIMSTLFNRKYKMTILKTLIKPVFVYGCEAWEMFVKMKKD